MCSQLELALRSLRSKRCAADCLSSRVVWLRWQCAVGVTCAHESTDTPLECCQSLSQSLSRNARLRDRTPVVADDMQTNALVREIYRFVLVVCARDAVIDGRVDIGPVLTLSTASQGCLQLFWSCGSSTQTLLITRFTHSLRIIDCCFCQFSLSHSSAAIASSDSDHRSHLARLHASQCGL